MKRILNKWKAKQRGFTLIEIILSLFLTGVLSTSVATFVLQSYTEGSKAKNRMNAITQVGNAGYWVSRDVQMSENVTLGDPYGFPLQLAWQDMEGNVYEATYFVDGGQLNRSLIENESAPVQTLVAPSLDTEPSLTSISYNDGLYTFNVSATSNTTTVSRSYQIKKRLDIE